MINKGDMAELTQTYQNMVETEDLSDTVFQEIVKERMESVNQMLKLPVEFGNHLDTMLNSVTNSKKRLREAHNCLQMSTEALVNTNTELMRTTFVLEVLEAIEELNNLIFNITQKIEKGLFFDGLQVYLQAKHQFDSLDEGIRHAPLVVRLSTVLESKRTEIQQLCIYFLVEQIFNTEVLNPADDLFAANDFRKLVFKLADEHEDEHKRDLFPVEDEAPRLERAFDGVTQPKQKIFGDRRVKFLFSMVKSFQGFTSPQNYLEFLELTKIDATLDLMFDKETVKIFEELSKSKTQFSQADDQINYYNIFLSIRGIRQLDPQCSIPEVLLSNLEENFSRIILNCMNAYLRESMIQLMNSHRVEVQKKPLLYWLDEFAKEMLPNSFLLASVPNLETVSRLFVLIVFYCLQYLSDFTKICLFLGDNEAIKQNLGGLVVCMSQKISFIMEKMFLRPMQTKEEENMMFTSEDLLSKSFEIYKKLQLTRGYFPFVVQIVMRMLNKGLNSLEKRLDPALQMVFTNEAKIAMSNFSENLYQLYFTRLKSDSAFERVVKQPKNLDVFHFKQSDKDVVLEHFFPRTGQQGTALDLRFLQPQINQFDRENFKVYLPAAEYIKVLLADIATLFTMMKYEHHQKYILGLYNWTLFQFIQLLVSKFSEDINDFNMNTLKKSLGFKELLAADYSYSQFRSHVALEGAEEEAHYLPPEEYLKVLENTYSWKSLQASKLPIDAFREDRYVKTGEGCSIVLNCFVAVKQSFNSDFLRILGSTNEEVIRRMVNQNMMQEDRASNLIERDTAQNILSVEK